MYYAILRYLGLMPISEHRDSIAELSSEILQLNEFKRRFEKPDAPINLFNSFIPDPESKKCKWSQFWNKHCRNYYSAWALNILSLHPDIIVPFFRAFAEFDWKGTAEYMDKVKWFWQNDKCSPSIEDLQMAVLDLLLSSLKNEKTGFTDTTGCSSGGFELRISTDGADYKVSILFKEYDQFDD
jgi:hypothetical protein